LFVVVWKSAWALCLWIGWMPSLSNNLLRGNLKCYLPYKIDSIERDHHCIRRQLGKTNDDLH
jgi:hypothetical protein